MLMTMRTTLVIDDYVLMEAKRQAMEAGMTLSDFTTLSLRETLRKRDHPPSPSFSMPTYGAGTAHTSSPREIAALRDEGR